jgi:hypothetical protein
MYIDSLIKNLFNNKPWAYISDSYSYYIPDFSLNKANQFTGFKPFRKAAIV